MTITRIKLMKIAQRRCDSLSRGDVTNVVEQFLSEIILALATEGNVNLRGFGRFKVRAKADRLGRNPKTGEQHRVTARRVVSFKPCVMMQRVVNRRAGASSTPTLS